MLNLVTVLCYFGTPQQNLGLGLLSQFPPFRYFPKFSSLSKHTLTVKYGVHIWQVSPQLSCGDTFQIWMWFEESNMYFCEIENFAYGGINKRSFSNPTPVPSDPTACVCIRQTNTHDQSVKADRQSRKWLICVGKWLPFFPAISNQLIEKKTASNKCWISLFICKKL